MPEILVGMASEAGRREVNEDRFLVDTLSPERSSGVCALIGVADGMGGLNRGDVASFEALAALRRNVTDALGEMRTPVAAQLPETATSPAQLSRILEVAVREANDAVLAVGGLESADRLNSGGGQLAVSVRARAGPALPAALVTEDEVVTCHVGDTRLYHLTDGELHVMTRDHQIRKALTNRLGCSTMEADCGRFHLRPGEAVLICSDGVHDVLAVDVMARIISETVTIQNACDSILREALRRGSRDNVTVVAVERPPIPRVSLRVEPPAALPRSRGTREPESDVLRQRHAWLGWSLIGLALAILVGAAFGLPLLFHDRAAAARAGETPSDAAVAPSEAGGIDEPVAAPPPPVVDPPTEGRDDESEVAGPASVPPVEVVSFPEPNAATADDALEGSHVIEPIREPPVALSVEPTLLDQPPQPELHESTPEVVQPAPVRLLSPAAGEQATLHTRFTWDVLSGGRPVHFEIADDPEMDRRRPGLFERLRVERSGSTTLAVLFPHGDRHRWFSRSVEGKSFYWRVVPSKVPEEGQAACEIRMFRFSSGKQLQSRVTDTEN